MPKTESAEAPFTVEEMRAALLQTLYAAMCYEYALEVNKPQNYVEKSRVMRKADCVSFLKKVLTANKSFQKQQMAKNDKYHLGSLVDQLADWLRQPIDIWNEEKRASLTDSFCEAYGQRSGIVLTKEQRADILDEVFCKVDYDFIHNSVEDGHKGPCDTAKLLCSQVHFLLNPKKSRMGSVRSGAIALAEFKKGESVLASPQEASEGAWRMDGSHLDWDEELRQYMGGLIGATDVKFTKISYDTLNPKQQENYNFQKLNSVLADYGFNCIKLSDDWEGADFLASHINGVTTWRVQLKGRCYIAKRYMQKGLYVAFPVGERWCLIQHDLLVLLARKHTMWLQSKSWMEDGVYHTASPSAELMEAMGEYLY